MPYQKIASKIQMLLEDDPEILVATLFGSAVKNRLVPSSDVDVAVAGERPLSYEKRIELMLSLSDALSCEIDLVDLQAVSGPILQQALCSGIMLKKASPKLLAALIKKMWYNQADMMPYSRMILEKHCQRFAYGQNSDSLQN